MKSLAQLSRDAIAIMDQMEQESNEYWKNHKDGVSEGGLVIRKPDQKETPNPCESGVNTNLPGVCPSNTGSDSV